jgi:3-hydroxyisobutyrate dehydrogenase-like beta-hydroxyacid dehydrogenase
LHKAHGSHYLAAPVAGHPQHAATGKLLSFVAGESEAFERARPILEAYSAKIVRLGEAPALASSFKLVVNFFAASLLETIGEAFVFAEKQGIDLVVMSGMLKDLLQHPAFPVYLEKIRTRNFEEILGSTLDGAGSKDVRIIVQTAAELHVPLPVASLVRDKILAAQALGFGQHDWSVLTEISRLNAGQEVVGKAKSAGS